MATQPSAPAASRSKSGGRSQNTLLAGCRPRRSGSAFSNSCYPLSYRSFAHANAKGMQTDRTVQFDDHSVDLPIGKGCRDRRRKRYKKRYRKRRAGCYAQKGTPRSHRTSFALGVRSPTLVERAAIGIEFGKNNGARPTPRSQKTAKIGSKSSHGRHCTRSSPGGQDRFREYPIRRIGFPFRMGWDKNGIKSGIS